MSNKVLVLRTCRPDYTSHDGFCLPDKGGLIKSNPAKRINARYGVIRFPEKGPVEAPDWSPDPNCGNGLHGLLCWRGDWELFNYNPDAIWQVVEVDADAIVAINKQKVKFPRGNVIYSGSMAKAVKMVLCNLDVMDSADQFSNGNYSTAASSGENSSAASSGYCSTAASSGHGSSAISGGNYSTASSSGYRSLAASSGKGSSASSSGYNSRAASSGKESTSASSGIASIAESTGDGSIATSSGNCSRASAQGKDTIAMAAGVDCIVSAGENGCFASVWYDPVRKRNLIKVGYVGRRGIKAETPYKLTQYGQWEEVK